MDDAEVIQAFVSEGARRGFAPTLHIEGDCLFYDGWWQSAFRVNQEVFAVRNEDPPGETTVLADVRAALAERGLQQVSVNPPLLYVITYAEIALGLVQWAVWAADAAAADAALQARAGEDSFLNDYAGGGAMREADYTAELGGARRNAGLPPSLILSVGVSGDRAAELASELTDCRIETRALGEIEPDMCGALVPTLVLVDATTRTGEEFVMRLREAACGRVLPVVAVTAGGPPPGADAAVDPGTESAAWLEPIRRLLP
jgi:hypothetical protein